MQARDLFRVGLYAFLCLAALGLWLGEDSPLPYPWLFILLTITAYAFTDQWRVLVIPGPVAPWLGLAALALFIREELAYYKLDPVLPFGHLLLFLVAILLFHEKTTTRYRLLFLLGFLLLLIAALHNNRLRFGILMGVSLTCAAWALTQFLLVREAESHHDPTRQPVRLPVKRTVASSMGSSAVIFALGTLLFLFIPRREQVVWSQVQYQSAQHLSGFDERIRLGQLGTILESDEEVMTVRMFDENEQPYVPRDEPYWRGIALMHYQAGRWERRLPLEPSPLPVSPPTGRFVRQEIRLQAVHRDVLFGMRPVLWGQTRAGNPLRVSRLDGTLSRPEDEPSGPLNYTIDSALDNRLPQPREFRPRHNEDLVQLPSDLRDELRSYVAALNPPAIDNPFLLADFLMNHLQNPQEFDYTLLNDVMDPTLDPVLDFLRNRKAGHCEYFASALALMLRAHNIPARVVNGFKGGDWNELLGKTLVVRQKHAHSWVEAIIRTTDNPEPHWITLDPTPGPGRRRIVSMVNPTPSLLRQVRDFSRQVWSSYILNFNSAEQQAAIYGPLRRLATTLVQSLVQAVKAQWAEQPRGFNWLAAIAAAVLMTGFLIILRLVARLVASGTLVWAENGRPGQQGLFGRLARRVQDLLARWAIGGQAIDRRVAFYDQLVGVLASRGMHKDPTATPLQFAERATSQLSLSQPAAPVAQVPVALVDHYYRVRFGREHLNDHELAEIGRMLAELTKALSVETLRS